MLDILMILLSYHLSYFVLSYVILCSFVSISVSLLIVPAQDIDPSKVFSHFCHFNSLNIEVKFPDFEAECIFPPGKDL